jgi:hypothetical protein
VNAKPLAIVVLRAGVWFLTVATLAVGVVATLAPRAFYDRAPWVSLAPPYSEHLMRDFGAMNLALALVMVVTAITLDRLMVRTSLTAYEAFAVPHLLFHVTHHQHYTTAQAVGETTALVVAALVPIGLLLLTRRNSFPAELCRWGQL